MCMSHSQRYPLHVHVTFSAVPFTCACPIFSGTLYMSMSHSQRYPLHVHDSFSAVPFTCACHILSGTLYMCMSHSQRYPLKTMKINIEKKKTSSIPCILVKLSLRHKYESDFYWEKGLKLLWIKLFIRRLIFRQCEYLLRRIWCFLKCVL